MDSTAELWEAWFTTRGVMVSLSPPSNVTEQDMELGTRLTEVLPRLFEVDPPTVQIRQVEPGSSESTQWLQPAWFERGPK